jgi:hypothetical protein
MVLSCSIRLLEERDVTRSTKASEHRQMTARTSMCDPKLDALVFEAGKHWLDSLLVESESEQEHLPCCKERSYDAMKKVSQVGTAAQHAGYCKSDFRAGGCRNQAQMASALGRLGGTSRGLSAFRSLKSRSGQRRNEDRQVPQSM